ncbi:MAG TPA: VOC family protein [Opitutales bacterium]|nr:VOC family protein [Opitutales bacterium]
MQIKGTDFVLYEVSDLDRSVEFYRDVLGLKQTWRNDEVGGAEFDLVQTTLSLYAPQKAEGRTPAPGGTLFIAVANVQQAVEQLLAKGVSVIFGPMDTPVCEMACFLDPDGNRLGLHHRKDGTVG